jgi:hypothetical protein
MLKTVKTAGAKGRAGRAGAVRRSRGRQEDGGAVEPKPEGRTVDSRPRPTDTEIAERLRGTSGRLFVHDGDGIWRDAETGATGTRAEIEQAWLAEM